MRETHFRNLRGWATLSFVLTVAGILVFFGVHSRQATASTRRDRATAPLVSSFPSLPDRFGVGLVGSGGGHIEDYDVRSLHIGWYLDWTYWSQPAWPGLDFARLIRVKPASYPPDWNRVASVARAHPGSLWLVGNEPEGVYGQGQRTPPEYAQIYHQVYTFLKDVDPTATVAIGGVIEPTPLRLKWLDQVLESYQSQYGEPAPVDAWNTHVQILQEKRGDWGAAIPAGLPDDQGRLYTVKDNGNPDKFHQLIEELRQWMKERGFQNKPLIVSEFGVAMPYCYLVDEPGCAQDLNASVAGRMQVRYFITQTVGFLANTQDPLVGYPADGNRLVQQWLWFSLDGKPFDMNTRLGFSGSLFDWQTREMTEFGRAFSDTVASQATPYVDLTLRSFDVTPDVVVSGVPLTLTLQVRVANRGEIAVPDSRVRFWNGDPDQGGPPVGGDRVVADSLQRFGPGALVTARWANLVLAPGQRVDVYAGVDPDDEVAEGIEENNRLHHVVWAPRYRLYLPFTRR